MSLSTIQQVVPAQDATSVATTNRTTFSIMETELDLSGYGEVPLDATEFVLVPSSGSTHMVYLPAEMVPVRFLAAQLQQQGYFGKLPAEIRNRIFHLILSAPSGTMIFGGLRRGYKHNITVALLSTCQQFFQEGRYIFYNDNAFVFENMGFELLQVAKTHNLTYKGPVLPASINLGIPVTGPCIKFITLHLGDDNSQEEGCHKIEQFIRSLDSMRNTIQVQELTLSFCNFAWDFKVEPAMLARALAKLAVVNCITIEAPIDMWYDENLARLPQQLGMYYQPIYVAGDFGGEAYLESRETGLSIKFFNRCSATYYRNIAREVAAGYVHIDTTRPDDSVAEASSGAIAE